MTEMPYGLIVEDDLVWLRQQTSTVCLTPGLEGLERPSSANNLGRLRCPHLINPNRAAPEPQLQGLARVLRPVPDGGAYFSTARPAQISDLLKMSAIVERVMFPTWAVPIQHLVPHLTLTNLAPMVIVDCEPKNFIALQRLLSMPRTRTVICLGKAQPPMTTRLELERIDPFDWTEAGAGALHAHVVDIVKRARAK